MRAIAIFLLLSAALAGCTSLARPIAEAAVSTDEIVRAVECELASVFLDESVNSRILMASHSLTKLDLVVTDDNAISPGLSFETKTSDMTITAVPRNRFGDKTIRTQRWTSSQISAT